MKNICSILLLLTLAFSSQAAMSIYEFDSPNQEQVFKDLGKALRCPKCQNNNIADSNSALAQDLRGKVYEMLKANKTQDEIVDYMKARYGNFVTYDPPLTPLTLLLWLGPILFMLIGFVMLFRMSQHKAAKKVALSESEKARLAVLLQDKDDNL